MKTSPVAKRYAKAIFVVTKQKGIHQKALEELKQLSQVISESPDAVKYFSSPVISSDKKISLVRELASAGKTTEEVANALIVLGEKNRLSELSSVVTEFQSLIDAEDGVTRGVVYSAQALSADSRIEIEQKIRQALNKKVLLAYEQDATLLGGVVAQVGGWTFDDSLNTHLKKLNEDLNRRAK